MGQAIIAQIADWPGLVLAGAVERAGHPSCGRTAGPGHPETLTICSNIGAITHVCDVLIDFSAPSALAVSLEAAQEGGCALLIGTTGLEAEHHAAIAAAARDIAVLQAANTSLGVTLLARLVEQAAAALGPDWDIEIAELHHRLKVDAPSGTALALGEAAAKGRGIDHGVMLRLQPGGADQHGATRLLRGLQRDFQGRWRRKIDQHVAIMGNCADIGTDGEGFGMARPRRPPATGVAGPLHRPGQHQPRPFGQRGDDGLAHAATCPQHTHPDRPFCHADVVRDDRRGRNPPATACTR